MDTVLGFDTETTGLSATDRAFGVSYSLTGGPKGYIDLRCDDPAPFLDLVSNTDCPLVAHNVAFDFRMLAAAGYTMPIERLDDTVIRATLINEHEYDYTLDALAKKYLGEEKDSSIYEAMAELFGGRATRSAQIHRIAMAPREVVAPYAIKDAELVERLWQKQREMIWRDGLSRIVDFERGLMPTIIRTEMRGIRVDIEQAHRTKDELTKIITNQSNQLFQLVGKTFNINSPKEVGDIFKPSKNAHGQWVTTDGHVVPATPGGKPSFSADALREINSPVSRAIIELRSLEKTRDTFIAGHVIGNEVGGRVYPSIHQTKGEDGGTGTGRFSYSGPAMQQIPSRNLAVASVVKPIFLPEEGHVWVDADKHSFEVRVFAHLVNNREVLEQYRNNPEADFHQMVADMTGLPRSAKFSGQANAKQLNLSMIFNSGNGAIAEKMGMPFTWDSFRKGEEEFRYKKAGPEAMAVIEAYHERLPGIRELATKAKKLAEAYGYVETHFGRRLRFPGKRATYKASGLAIQATAADINKNNWPLIENALGGNGHLILNTHDSYSMSMPKETWEKQWLDVKNSIESSYPWFRVPLILELSGAGPNWWMALGK